MSQVITNNRTKENIQFINHDKGDGNNNELSFKCSGLEITILRSGKSVEVIIDEQAKETEKE